MRALAIACVAIVIVASAAEPPPGNANAVSGDGFILVASYDRSSWSGDLIRIDVGATMPAWSAAERLPAPSERRIYTSVPSGAGTALVEFMPGAVPGLDRDLIDYLRGDRSREGRGMRARAHGLGDIVRSVPVIVDAGNGPPLAYVGANDGMLHAFDIATGVERFAYIPRALHGSLAELARPDYRHRGYVDAPPGAGAAEMGSTRRTVLASGFGMDQNGLFAIDISNPDRFAAGAGELWQFTSDDDRHMGRVVAAAAIAKLRIGTRNGEPRYRYFAIVPSESSLFLLALDKPEQERWRQRSNYYRFTAGAGQDGNVLGPMAVIPGPDGSVQYVYAGDIQGRLWRFDFTGTAPWRNAVSQLFTATDEEGARQPISTAPRIVHAPSGGHLVLFGTSGIAGTQSLYAVHDPLNQRSVPATTRRALTRRRLSASETGYRITGADIEYGRDSGWYIDFARSESLASSPFVDSGVLVVSTSVPSQNADAAPEFRTYVLSAVTGLPHSGAGVTGSARNGSFAGPAILVRSGTTRGARDVTGRAMAVRRYSFVPPAPGAAVPPPIDIAIPVRRLSWREILNWDELHRAATEGGGDP